MATFNISANDTDMGEYRGASAAEALDAYAEQAGYKDYQALAAEAGDDAMATQIDTEALCNAVSDATGHAVFEDSYGTGVALVNSISYATYQDLARSIGKNSWDFEA